jgi:hypothetical protein
LGFQFVLPGLYEDRVAEHATGVVREWDDFGSGMRMRIYESGATEAANMMDDPNCPFRMYTFPEMAQPAKSKIPILLVAAPPLDMEVDVKKKPAANQARKRPAAVVDEAHDDKHPTLHAFQITSTVTSMPVRNYFTACRCSEPEPCCCY